MPKNAITVWWLSAAPHSYDSTNQQSVTVYSKRYGIITAKNLNYYILSRRTQICFHLDIIYGINRTQFKTVAKFCNTVVAATSILMPIWVLFVFVPLLCSVTNTSGTKIGIKIDVAVATVLRNFATVLN